MFCVCVDFHCVLFNHHEVKARFMAAECDTVLAWHGIAHAKGQAVCDARVQDAQLPAPP